MINIKKTKIFKFVLWKSYFDKGYSWLSFPKYIFLLLLGADTLASKGDNVLTILIAGGIFMAICFILGKILYKKKFVDSEAEVSNIFNPFVREMRRKINNGKVFK